MMLEELARKYGTDKTVAEHGYMPFYESALRQHWRDNARVIFEIGVYRGASIRMWRDYFATAHIWGFDSSSSVAFNDRRITILRGNQAQRADLLKAMQAVGQPIDVLIDDGGHTMEQQQVSLGYLFKYLSPGGLYVIEDLWTSYWHGTPACPKGWFNPTKTEWTTLHLLETMAAGKEFHSAFMTAWEMRHLKAAIKDMVIYKGRNSEIAFITKKEDTCPASAH